MTETELRNEIKAPRGCYFLYGDEDYMKNHYAARIRDAVVTDPGLALFNSLRFSDDGFDLAALRDALLSPPVMAEQKFVELSFTNLEQLLNERERTALLSLLEEAAGMDDVVVVLKIAAGGFDAGTAKKPSAFLKNASKFMKTAALDYQSDARLVRWLERHFAEYGLTLPQPAAARILETCGRSMYRLSGEIAKTAAYAAAAGRSEVTVDDVDATVTRTDEDDAFRLTNCVLEGNIPAALDALAVKMRKREEPYVVLAQITRVFCDLAAAAHAREDGLNAAEFARRMKMHTYRAGLYFSAAQTHPVDYFDRAVARCAEADRKMKSTPLGYALIERLICG
ncbi:MAG: DNA polymerase III subunit delta [Eubacteriales bacterium]